MIGIRLVELKVVELLPSLSYGRVVFPNSPDTVHIFFQFGFITLGINICYSYHTGDDDGR
jgi:hypothetical protein